MREITKLDNGLTIVTEKKAIKNMLVYAFVRAGSLMESKELSGISHFIEHTVFKGTTNMNSVALTDFIEKEGGQCNAFTGKNYTCFTTNIIYDKWQKAVDFLSFLIKDPIFPEDEIEKERNVILQEYYMSKDNPESELWNNIFKTYYKDQVAARPIIGTLENLKAFTRNDLVNYFNAGYTAENIIISACGPVAHKEIVDYVAKLFDTFPRNGKLVKSTNNFVTGNTTLETDNQQSHVVLGLKGIDINSKDFIPFILYQTIMGEGLSSRIFKKLREECALVYTANFLTLFGFDTNCFGIRADVKKENIDKAIDAIHELFEESKHTITQEELNKAKNTALFTLALETSDPEVIVSENGAKILLNTKFRDFKLARKQINSVILKDIYDFTDKYITDDFNTLVIKSNL